VQTFGNFEVFVDENPIVRKWKQLAVMPDKLPCDFYEMLNGNAKAANS